MKTPAFNKRKIKYYRLVWFKHDLPAGLTVFLVALPLCLGIALASGAPLYAGIVSGVIGGVVVSFISGSNLGVSGPAAGLSTVVAASVISLGDYRTFLVAVVLAGIIQLILGLFKLGTISNYFPSAVIKGMLAAIGIILISKQIPLALGYNQPDFWTSGFISLLSAKNFLGNLGEFNKHITPGATIVSVVSVGILILFQKPKVKRFFGILPAPLLVVALGILANFLFQRFLPLFELDKHQLVTIPQNIFASIQFPDFRSMLYHPTLLVISFEIALLASLETLLSVEAIDKLDNQNRITPVNRELIAQGIGNISCGLLGGIPITSVIVRGSANIDAGARTKLAAFTHGVFLLLAVLTIPFVINRIPYASLASILLVTGFNLTRPRLVKSMFKLGWKQFVPFIATIIVILLTDLLIGVAIGLLISMYYIIQNNIQEDFTITKKLEHYTDHFTIKLNSNVTFLNKVKLRDELDNIPEYSILTINGKDCNFIDYDVLETISEFEGKAHKKHIEVHLEGIDKVETVAAAH